MKLTKSNIKERIKGVIGEDNYLQFMNDLSNVSLTLKDLGDKYDISHTTVAKWISILDYTHTPKVKQQLRTAYRIAARIKKRKETARKIFDLLKKAN